MPPKGEEISAMRFSAHGSFILMRSKLNQEIRKSGKECADAGTRSVASEDRQHVDLRVPPLVMSSEVETSLTNPLIT
ncbi:MAG TPA: hypothetical protein VGI41_04515 [Candidatus Udaeobacter sp.]